MNPPQAPGLVPTDSKDQATWMSNVMNTIAHTASKSNGQAQTVAEALSRTYQGVSRRCVSVSVQRVYVRAYMLFVVPA